MLELDKFIYLEWIISYACNFQCSYCFFGPENLKKSSYLFHQHGPRRPDNVLERWAMPIARKVGVLDYADSFKNYPLEKWLDFFTGLAAIRQHLYLSLTGGEPLVLQKEIVPIIAHLNQHFERVKVRIDTNGSIVPTFAGVDPGQIEFNVSYHPTQIALDKLLANLEQLGKVGKVCMVNRVFSKSDMATALQEADIFASYGYFMNASLENFTVADFDEVAMQALRSLRTPLDVDYPVFDKNIGRSCAYPTFGMQMMPNGYAWVPPCDQKQVLDVVNDPNRVNRLLAKKPIACPAKCVCFHQFAWAGQEGYQSMDIVDEYVQRNVAWRKQVKERDE